MVRSFGLLIVAVVLAGLAWFQFGQQRSAAEWVQRSQDLFDRRPARSILIVGNSRTYFHDMPLMIRRMADSADSPIRYDTAVEALPGASFESLWGEPATQALLQRRWDDAIFQGESRGQSDQALTASFLTYGAKLIGATHLRSGAPRLVVNWAYAPELYTGDTDGRGRVAHMRAIQDDHAELARRTGARLINVGQLWEEVRVDHPRIVLTEDGNHPTLAGSYLFALALYADLSRQDVGRVSYLPAGLSPGDAADLRSAVRDWAAIAAR
jgi:hypothetical protein